MNGYSLSLISKGTCMHVCMCFVNSWLNFIHQVLPVALTYFDRSLLIMHYSMFNFIKKEKLIVTS